MGSEGKNTLDLRRDLGWLLYGIDEDEKGAALSDLKQLITANKIDFADEQSFTAAIKPSTFQDCDRVTGLWCSEASAMHVLERAKFFFDRHVQAETEVNGNVLYVYDQDRGWLGSKIHETPFWSAQLLVDYDTTGYELFRSLSNCDSEKVLSEWDQFFNESVESEHVSPQDEILDTGELDHDYLSKATGKARQLNISDEAFKKYIVDVASYYEISPNQALQVYAEGYLEFLAAIKPADQKRVLQSLFKNVATDWKKEATFLSYTSGSKYPVHREYAEKLHQLNPKLSTDDLMAIAFIESSGNKAAVSSDNAHFGLMQLGPSEFRKNLAAYNDKPELVSYGLEVFNTDEIGDTGLAPASSSSIFSFKPNLAAGSTYLNDLLMNDKNTNPTRSLAVAVAAYNWGPGSMEHYLKLSDNKPVDPDLLKKSKYKTETEYRCAYQQVRGQTVDYLAKFLYFRTRLEALNEA